MENPEPPRRRGFCSLVFMELQKPCMVCNGHGLSPVVRPRTYCSGCDTSTCVSRNGATKNTMRIFIEEDIGACLNL
jgi:hypothetical protein